MNPFNFFGLSSNSTFELDSRWNSLESLADWKQALAISKEKKILVFKHSTGCHVSKTVLRNFQNEMQDETRDFEYYYLDLLAHRNLSNEIASAMKVIHQSPQLLVIENGTCVENSSHQAISLSLV